MFLRFETIGIAIGIIFITINHKYQYANGFSSPKSVVFPSKPTKFLFTQLSSPKFFATSLYQSNVSTESSTRSSSFTIKEDILKNLDKCTSGTIASQILTDALIEPNSSNDDNSKALYKSLKIPPQASSKFTSDADLAIQTQIRNQKKSVLELIETNGDADADRASLFLFGLMIASPITSIQFQSFSQNIGLPVIINFAIVWLLAFSPLFFVGAGLAIPDQLQRQMISLQTFFFPSYQKRMIQHEAGHMLMGHLLGYSIKNYQIKGSSAIRNAVEFYPLADESIGSTRANLLGFDKQKQYNDDEDAILQKQYEERMEAIRNSEKPFFSDGGRGDELLQKSVFQDAPSKKEKLSKNLIAPENDSTSVWPYRVLNENTLDILAVVSLAGVCTEILGFGNAQGGVADLNQLTAFLKSNDCTDEEIENKIRFAIGYNFSQLRRHMGVLDELAEAMEKGQTVAECVSVMERCANVAGLGTVMERYEDTRKRKFEQEWNLQEKVLLGRQETSNGERTDVIEGKGGGGTKDKFLLTGDDPFYAALALAFAFFVWASSGGLSLH